MTSKNPLQYIEKLQQRITGLEQELTACKERSTTPCEGELRFQAIADASPDMIHLNDLDGRIVYVNPATERLLGYAAEDMTGRSALDFIHPEDHHLVHESMVALVGPGRQVGTYEIRLLKKNGDVLVVEVSGFQFQRGEGQGHRIGAILRDISARRATEEDLARYQGHLEELVSARTADLSKTHQALQESELRYGALYNAMNEGLAIHELVCDGAGRPVDYRILEVNSAYEKIIDLKREEVCGRLSREVYGAKAPPYLDEFSRVALTGVPLTFETYFEPLDAYFEISVSALQPGMFATLFSDISETKRSEQALRQLQHLSSQILRSAGEGIFGIDRQGLATFVNPAAAQMLGWQPEEMVGQDLHQLVHHSHDDGSSYDARQCPMHVALRDGSIHSAREELFWRKDGSSFSIEFTSRPIIESGEIVGMVVTFVDSSDRKRIAQEQQNLQAQLIQAQKMETVGQLAGGIAHDFNNLLSVIMGFSDLARLKLSEGDPVCEDLAMVREASTKAATLTRQLLAFSRKQVLDMQVVTMESILESMAKMLGRLLGEDVMVEIQASGHHPVLADAGQLEQVLLNLAVNARDAMREGGTFRLQSDVVELGRDIQFDFTRAEPGTYVRLQISDTGSGIDPSFLKHIFEPFFTTKEKGKGTGLGLAMVYGIIQQHQGYVTVSSEKNKGTTFEIYLPMVRKSGEEQEDSSVSLPPSRGNETILVVEDQEQVRSLLARILEGAGYTLLTAEDGLDALRCQADWSGNIDLLVTDVVMPRMNGPELVKNLLETRPETRVLFISGYPDAMISRHGVLEAGIHFLQKPVSAEKLLNKVREILDAQ